MCSCKLDKFEAYAPGKIMLAGEWAVLELGIPCVSVPFQKGIKVTVESSEKIFFEENKFTQSAVDIALKYIQANGKKIAPFSISINSEISEIYDKNSEKKLKPGLGSSSAVVVAIIKGLLKFFDLRVDAKIVFKLASIAHYLAQGKIGSCYDVAVSTYNFPIIYKRFDPDWFDGELKKFLKNEICIIELIDKSWPFLEIEKIDLPSEMKVYVGFSGESSSTTKLIESMNKFKIENKKKYLEICSKIGRTVEELVFALKNSDVEKILKLFKQNKELLNELSKSSGIILETKALKKLCDDFEKKYGGVAKISGAGGGDCFIAVCF